MEPDDDMFKIFDDMTAFIGFVIVLILAFLLLHLS